MQVDLSLLGRIFKIEVLILKSLSNNWKAWVWVLKVLMPSEFSQKKLIILSQLISVNIILVFLISIIYAQCIIANIYHMWICLLSNNSNLDIIEWIRTRNFKNGGKKTKKKSRHITHLKSRKCVHRKYCFKNL